MIGMKWISYVKGFFLNMKLSIFFVFIITPKNHSYRLVTGQEGETRDVFILCTIYFLAIIFWKKNILTRHSNSRIKRALSNPWFT